MNIKDLTIGQLQTLIETIVEAKIEEIQGDPDEKLE